MTQFVIAFARWVMSWLPGPARDQVYLELSIGPVTEQSSNPEEMTMALLTLLDNQQARVSIAPVSKAGNPAKIDGVPVWSSSNADIVVVPEESGLAALVRAAGPIAAGTITITADADLGEGVKPIEGKFNVAVEGGQAADFGISFGDVVDQPPAEPAPTPAEPAPPA